MNDPKNSTRLKPTLYLEKYMPNKYKGKYWIKGKLANLVVPMINPTLVEVTMLYGKNVDNNKTIKIDQKIFGCSSVIFKGLKNTIAKNDKIEKVARNSEYPGMSLNKNTFLAVSISKFNLEIKTL
jgi:hypothetical protein